VTIRKFDRIVMGVRGLFVDLPENRCGVPHALRPTEEAAVCDEKPIRKAISVAGRRQTAVSKLSGAAKPLVPALKL
jgi:hypothetical protein